MSTQQIDTVTEKGRAKHSKAELKNVDSTFAGFTRLDANFLYCPNQFLDVCLANYSRGVVRLVAYMLDQTLGWLDKQGNPISQNITVSFNQMIRSAGVSRGAARKALDQALSAGFIRCVQEGRPATQGRPAETATYALCWDETGDYQESPENFCGFYAGEGYRTPIPNAFFRQVIPHETLTVTKVVGTVLRHTVGYQNQFGGRRAQAPLSYRFIQAFANIGDPKSLSQAISSAIASKYIVCVEEGHFHPDPAKRQPASYAIHWLQDQQTSQDSSKSLAKQPINSASEQAVQKTQQGQFNKPSQSGSKIQAAEQFKNPSKEKTSTKYISKQQAQETVVANSKGVKLLTEAGFDEATAERLLKRVTPEQIEQQIAWLPLRNPDHNRLGMLRRALEENWSKPIPTKDIKAELQERRERDRRLNTEEQLALQRASAEKSRRRQHREKLKQLWDDLSTEEQQQIETAAYERLQGEMLRNLFHTRESHRLRACLIELDSQLTTDDLHDSSG